MKPPRLLTNHIPPAVLHFHHLIARQMDDPELINKIKPVDIQAYAAIEGLRRGQTFLIDPTPALTMARQPTTGPMAVPFPATILQFYSPCTDPRLISLISDHQAPIAALVIRFINGYNPKTDANANVPAWAKNVLTYTQDTIGIWTVHTDWYLELITYLAKEPQKIANNKLGPKERNRIVSRWHWAHNILRTITDRNLSDLAAHTANHKPIAKPEHHRDKVAYYICTIRPTRQPATPPPTTPSEPTGRHVGIQFDVIGHWRTYKSGKRVWIKGHRRGLEHPYVPKTYLVQPQP